jgi:hypothetical protein
MLPIACGATPVWEENADWKFGLIVYAWLPSLSGNLNYGSAEGGGGVEVDAGKIIDALQMTLMGSFEARKGPWSGITDVIYLDLAGDKPNSVSLPSGAMRELFDAELELEGWLWTLAAPTRRGAIERPTST